MSNYDIARYNYHIVILANCSLPLDQMRRLTEGHAATAFNFERSYNELVFPIISGTYYRAHDVTIHLDLNNKSAGAKTSYSVGTPDYQCEITVLFVPTLEIAKSMDKYRNTILEYNPRSYLELEGQQVNSSIRETLLRPHTNEFALMNNGITILSDETSLNERIGQENKAQLRLVRPQIINGGQTAYTLSRIYNEDKAGAEPRFSGKEVLTKIITLTPKDPKKDTSAARLKLIEEISAASNRQTPVISADWSSNQSMHTKLQFSLFDKFGILLERKRGEFNDGMLAGYINRSQVLERNLFFRIFFTAQGQLNVARRKRIFQEHKLDLHQLTDEAALMKFSEGYDLFRFLAPRREAEQSQRRYREVLAKVYIGMICTDRNSTGEIRAKEIALLWAELLSEVSQRRSKYMRSVRDAKSGGRHDVFDEQRWMASPEFERDMLGFVDGVMAARRVTGSDL